MHFRSWVAVCVRFDRSLVRTGQFKDGAEPAAVVVIQIDDLWLASYLITEGAELAGVSILPYIGLHLLFFMGGKRDVVQ